MFYILTLFFASIFSIVGFVFALNKKDSKKVLLENSKSASYFTPNQSRPTKSKWWSVFAWLTSFLTTTLTGVYFLRKAYKKPVSPTKLSQLSLLKQKLQAKRPSWLSKSKPNQTVNWKQRLQILLRKTRDKQPR